MGWLDDLVAAVTHLFDGRQSRRANIGHTDRDVSVLVDQLAAFGYYQQVAPDAFPAFQQQLINSGYVFGGEETGRDYHADAEDLTEGGVQEFLETIAPFLRSAGVQIESIEQVFEDGEPYTVLVNGKGYTMYTSEELASLGIWHLTAERALCMINTLLEEAGSNERICRLYDGNDTRAIFLTPPMYEAIVSSRVLPERDVPRPVECR